MVNIANQYRDPIGDTIGAYRVDDIDYDIDDPLTLVLWWGGVPTPFLYLAGRGNMLLGKSLGGLQDNESSDVKDGRILATSIAYTSGTATFSVVLNLVKQAFVQQNLQNYVRITGDGDVRITGDGNTRVAE